jgi:hypothetical protein
LHSILAEHLELHFLETADPLANFDLANCLRKLWSVTACLIGVFNIQIEFIVKFRAIAAIL